MPIPINHANVNTTSHDYFCSPVSLSFYRMAQRVSYSELDRSQTEETSKQQVTTKGTQTNRLSLYIIKSK